MGARTIEHGTYARVEKDMDQSDLKLHDVVVSKVPEGHLLLVMTNMPGDALSVLFRGTDWNIQYAVARGARLAGIKGGDLFYTSDAMVTLEYLETFRPRTHSHLN
jgi:hypothetical protein